MFCKECGAELFDGTRICVICGAVQDEDAPVSDKLSLGQTRPDLAFASGGDADLEPLEEQASLDELVPPERQASAGDSLGQQTFVAGDSVAPVAEKPAPKEPEALDATGSLNRTRPSRRVARAREAYPAAPSAEDAAQGAMPGFDWTDADEMRLAQDDDEFAVTPRFNPSHFAVKEERPRSQVGSVLVNLLIVAVVGAAGFGIYRFVVSNADEVADAIADSEPRAAEVVTEEEVAKAVSSVDLTVPVWVPWLDDEGSRVPVQVQGTSADGTKVDEVAYLSYEGMGLALDPGKYELRVVGSPISAEGVLYEFTDKSLPAIVAADGTCTFGDEPLTLTPIDATAVTDEQIEEAYQWVLGDTRRARRADKLAEAARERRRTVLKSQGEQRDLAAKRKAEEEAKKKEEEERKKAEEEAKKKEEEEAKQKAEEEAKQKAEEEAKKKAEEEAAKQQEAEPTPEPTPEQEPTPEPTPDPTPEPDPTPDPTPTDDSGTTDGGATTGE